MSNMMTVAAAPTFQATSLFYAGESHPLEFTELAPGIIAYHNILTPEMDIINRIEGGLAKPGTPYKWQPANLNFGHNDQTQRNCVDFKVKSAPGGQPGNIGPVNEYNQDFYNLYDQVIERLNAVLTQHYNPNHYIANITYFECINFVRYAAGEFFKVHTDDGDPYRCTVSCVGYPNDNYAGGELAFPRFGVKYKPKAGDFVIAPSAYVYAHSSEPVTDNGVKYSLVIMTDRNEFAHRNDSPTYHPKEYREQFGVPSR